MLRFLIGCFLIQLSVVPAAAELATPRRVDERRAAQVGLRKIVGQHLRLYTDLPPSDAVDSLPVVFDAAVPLWAEYFQIDLQRLRNWRMQGYLMQDRAKFAALGLLPKENLEFTNGYSVGHELWLLEQPSDYYRRHLLLHEGTHGFMYTQLGATGPGWYMEGMAELLGTHRWQGGQLAMRVIPDRRQDVPMWGRIKLVRDAYRDGKPVDLPVVMALDKRSALSVDEYAWCWSLCALLDSHPRWQEKFRQLPRFVGRQQFNQDFRELFRSEWADLLTEWRAFVATLDYGFDTKRMAMQHQPRGAGNAVSAGAEVTIAADRGWQSTGWLLKAGQSYRVTAEGRYTIAADDPLPNAQRDTAAQQESEAQQEGASHKGSPQQGAPQQGVSRRHADAALDWPCEPGGITLEYHAGRPLGLLLGAWRATATHQFSEPVPIGLTALLKPSEEAVLYLRVNDSPARLSDNRGTLIASIRPTAD